MEKLIEMQNLTEVFDEMDLADAESGLAALLPGMIRLREVVDAYIVRIQRKLGAIQNGHAAPRRGRPPKKADQTQAGKLLNTAGKGSSWAKMTAAERSREMKRRQAVARANRTAKEQAAYAAEHKARMSAAAKKRWAGMSKSAQKAQMAHMVAAKNKKPRVSMTNGSAA